MRLGAVNVSGVVGGFVVGFVILFFGGWGSFAILVTFFVFGSLATQMGYSKKGRPSASRRRTRGGAGPSTPSPTAAPARRPRCSATWAASSAGAAPATTGAPGVLAGGIRDGAFRHGVLGNRPALRQAPLPHHDAAARAGWHGRGGFGRRDACGARGAGLLWASWGSSWGSTGRSASLFVAIGAFVGTTFESIMGAMGPRRSGSTTRSLNFLNTLVGGATAGACWRTSSARSGRHGVLRVSGHKGELWNRQAEASRRGSATCWSGSRHTRTSRGPLPSSRPRSG